jgi:1-acyl-sn-glycerol-3-phosphate acyltransferase
VFVKKMLSYVPVMGWSWLMSDVVFLERDWDKDKLKLADKVKQVRTRSQKYLSDRDPILGLLNFQLQ